MAGAAKVVYVQIVAQTKRFNAGMKKAEKGLARVKKAVGLVSAAVLVIGAVALHAVSRKINEISKELDSMAKAAKGLEVSFAFLEDVQFVFKRLGGDGSVGTMTKMFKSLEKATAEAMSGSKEYTDLFDLLNINAQEFGELKQEEKVLAIHRAWSKSNKTTEQAAAMGDILGRGWNKNRAVFAASSEEFTALIDKRRELGGLTAEGGALAETFEDVKANVEQAKRGISDQVFKAIGPTFIKAAEGAEKFFVWLQKTGMMGPIVASGVFLIATAMGAAATAGIALMIAIAPISLTMLAISGAVVAVGAGLATLAIYWDDLGIAIRDFGDVSGPIMDKLTEFGGQVLGFMGFGSDKQHADSMGRAPTKGRSAFGGGAASTSSTTVNVDARGMTPAQVQALIKQQEQKALRGKGK